MKEQVQFWPILNESERLINDEPCELVRKMSQMSIEERDAEYLTWETMLATLLIAYPHGIDTTALIELAVEH